MLRKPSLLPWCVTGAICALWTATAFSGQTVGPNLKMNGPQTPMPSGRLGRPAMAIVGDPTGQRLLASWETMHGTCGGSFGGACTPPEVPGITAVGYSVDGGQTWTDLGPPYLGGDVMTSGRAWLDRGGADNQTFFLISRAASVEAAAPGMDAPPGGSNQSGLVFYRGRFRDDGTFAWTDQHLFRPSRPDLDLLRSPSIVAAKDGSGRVWVALSTLAAACGRRGTGPGEISIYRSADEGKTWEGPVLVSPADAVVPTDNRDPRCGTGVIQILPSMALGPKGELYVTWQYGPTLLTYNPFTLAMKTVIKVARSLDGGRTFNTPVPVALVNSMRQNPPVAYSKNTMNDIPRLAVATAGPYAGRVYLTYTSAVREAPSFDDVQILTSSQVYLAYSDDQGVSWSQPVPLGPPVPPDGVKRLWPAVAVRESGTVDGIYLESQEKQVTPDPDDVECKIGMVNQVTRAGKASSLMDVHWVQSTDGGATFTPPVRVTSETSNWCKVAFDFQTTQYANFGDLLGIYAAGDRTFAVWPDGRNGVPEAYFAELRGGGAPAPRPAKPAPGH